MIITIKLLVSLCKLAITKALAVPLEQDGTCGCFAPDDWGNHADIVTDIVNETHVYSAKSLSNIKFEYIGLSLLGWCERVRIILQVMPYRQGVVGRL